LGIRKGRDFANSTMALQAIVPVHNHQPSRIIATVFKPPQAFEQNGRDITLGNRTDNSTHR
jgi:hypothetical protein